MGLLNLRNALMAGKRLPYDAEVEYLESTGTQWIDTGVIPDRNTKLSVTASVTATTEQFMGAIDAGANRFHFSFYSAGYFRGCVGTQQTGMGTADQLVHTFTLDAPNNTVSEDGTSYSFITSGLIPSVSIWLFGRNSDNPNYVRRIMVRIYSCQIYQNGTLVRDFIPVRRGTVGYLYDRVSGQLFGNAGTGDFVLGQDVVPVEYIESHGTEYIDTGVNGSQNLRTTFDYQLVYSGTAPASKGLFGCYTSGAKYFLYCSGEATPRFQVGMGNAYTNSINVDELRHSIEYNNSEVSIDGNVVATYSSYEYPTAHTLLLFALYNANGSLYQRTPMRKWRVQMWDNGTPVRSFLPVRVGTEGAMMDVLTRRVYRNAGTGAFTYGNDLRYPIPAA